MNIPINISGKLSLLRHTFYFLKEHMMVIFGLGLIAALGRVIQLGGFGQVTPLADIFLEVIVALARLLIFFYVLGSSSFKKGILGIKQVFSSKENGRYSWRVAIQTIKKRWIDILVNMLVFLGIVWIINYLIDVLAYQTCLYLTLQKNEILTQTASEWTLILFFKNISVIPLTLTFETLLLLWLFNKLQRYKTVRTPA